jgi:fluoride ion exporter CrcB/FEX
MPTIDPPVMFIACGAGLGAVIRWVVLQSCSGAATPLFAAGIMTVLASFVAGLALGSGTGRISSFGLGLGVSTASLSLYALLGVTQRVVTSVMFVVSVPVLAAAAVTLGVVIASRLARSAGALR